MSNRNDRQLVADALTMAVWRRGQVKDVIVHSDRGATYASGECQKLLKRHRLVCSMSRKGECLDNAVAESLFSSLKTELVDHEDYYTKQETRQSLFEHIEMFSNRNDGILIWAISAEWNMSGEMPINNRVRCIGGALVYPLTLLSLSS